MITCPDPRCGRAIDPKKYGMHVESDHKLYTVDIKGVGPAMVMPQAGPRVKKFLDIPFIGRVWREGFVAYTFIMWLIGILMAGWMWGVIR